MKLRSLWKGTLLVAGSALLIAAVSLLGLLAFVWWNMADGRGWGTTMEQLSAALTREGTAYSFAGEPLLEEGHWAMLLDEEGRVVWSLRKPQDVPEQFALTDVASFTRWYLEDYPVRCWVREDGLLVEGAPKGSVWKHDIVLDTRALLRAPVWFLGCFGLALGGVLGLACLAVRHWFWQAQKVRDTARSGWINGVSHDIRTPLSVVMGYAAQLEEASDLPPARRRQAAAVRAQSQVIRDLVNDLNLTMRLDCAMQPLRRTALRPEAFVRQTAADFLNGGMAEGFDLEVDLPDEPLPAIEADPFLLRRAVNNLLTNCVRHNAPGCAIRLGARAEKGRLLLWVDGGIMEAEKPAPARPAEPDGSAAHGTGLQLVAQIAAAHGGRAEFFAGPPFRCELRLPAKG
ncbi:sensor histidine kinase [Candidatus Allofournierella merdavium]|uniref:sensor histidine kinase n=1 Tax=Candidatus Allofournierella merdavium TaxID=2838593 RepID=UPI00374F9BB4